MIQPLFLEFSNDQSIFTNRNSWLVSNGLLVQPIVERDLSSQRIYLPGDEPWFDLFSLKQVSNYQNIQKLKSQWKIESVKRKESKEMMKKKKENIEQKIRELRFIDIKVNIDTLPVFIRGGKTIVRKMKATNTSKHMFSSPYTIMVALDSSLSSEGYLYMDDEFSMNFIDKNEYLFKRIEYRDNVLRYQRIDIDMREDEVEDDNSFIKSMKSSNSQRKLEKSSMNRRLNENTSSPHLKTPNRRMKEKFKPYQPENTIEMIIILGIMKTPQQVVLKYNELTLEDAKTMELSYEYDDAMNILKISSKHKQISVAHDWSVILRY